MIGGIIMSHSNHSFSQQSILKVEQVNKIYKTGKTKVHALKDVYFEVESGNFTTISGPSGSGKTTLLNILGLLDSPTTGRVFLYGKPIEDEDFNHLADIRSMNFSFVFQTFNLNPVLSVEENIMLPLFIRKDITKEDKKRRVDEWMEKVGLYKHRTHKPDELSGGQRQRVSIARAMATEPALIFADEPTANLDSATSKEILSLMKKVNEEKGTAFIFSTHDPIIKSFARTQWEIIDGKLSKGDQ